jgi:tape measure domain-containing protein
MPNNNLEYTLRLKDLFSKTMQGAANQVKGLDSKMSGLKNSMSSLGGMVAGAFSVGAVVSFGKAVIDSLKNYEYFHASLKTLLKGNENAAKALEGQLINLAKTTPFQLTEVQDATKQLMAYGFKAGDVVDTMRTLGDVSSGIGAPLGDIAYLYGTLKTSGRVTLMDLRQFAGRGIPIYETLAKRLNTTTNGINKMVHDGKLGFKDIEGAFKDMTKEGGQFFNLMADQSKTVGGQLSNMGDSWEQLKVQVGKSQKGIIAGTVSFFSEMLNAFGSYFEQQNRMEEAFAKYGGKGDSFLDKIRNNFGLGSGLGGKVSKNTEYDAYIQSTMASKLSNTQKELKLNQEIVKISKLRASGFLSEDDYTNKLSQLKGAMDIMKGNKDISTMKENPTLGAEGKSLGGETSASKSLGTGTEVTGQRPQSLTINITKLVESLNVQTTNMTEGATKIKEMVSKALLEAVNDANLTAMT